MKKLIQFFKDEQGASGVEYGIMVAAVAAGIVVAAYSIGGKIKAAFTTVDNTMP
jgi:pilus assembly protein Flp/PilA